MQKKKYEEPTVRKVEIQACDRIIMAMCTIQNSKGYLDDGSCSG